MVKYNRTLFIYIFSLKELTCLYMYTFGNHWSKDRWAITVKVHKEQKIQINNCGEKGTFSNINEETLNNFSGMVAGVALE